MIELRQRTTARNGYHRINSEEDFQSIPRLNINEKKKMLYISIYFTLFLYHDLILHYNLRRVSLSQISAITTVKNELRKSDF
jgi:hypothetical protein